MKRLVLSVLGGFLIPFVYTMMIGSLPTYIQHRTLNKLLNFPIRWPMILLERLFSIDLFILQGYEPAILIYVIAADVLLYSFLTYLLLWRFWKQSPKASVPPEPPQFAAE